MVITHVDQDHILGAINFLEENSKKEKIIDVNEVWFNSFRHLQFEKEKRALHQDENHILKLICNQNKYRTRADGLHDITIEQGTTLSKLLYEGKYNWNSLFNNEAVFDLSRIKFFSNFLLFSKKTIKLSISFKKNLRFIFGG